jgi:ankyrin repeat protein
MTGLLLGIVGLLLALPSVSPAASLEEDLLDAVMYGESARVRELLQAGADPNTRDEQEATVLMWAAINGYRGIAEDLLAAGADVSARAMGGITALMVAATMGNPELVALLLSRGGDGNARTEDDGRTALYFAVEIGDLDSTIALLAAHADPNMPGTGGRTPLHLAVERGDPELVEVLLAAGADPSIPDAQGESAADLDGARDSRIRRLLGADDDE